MKDIFFDELNVVPDYDVEADTSDISILSTKMLHQLKQIRPSFVIVYGDTNTTVAGTIAAKNLSNCRVIHIEAGLRSFDNTMQEEMNRIYVDSKSDYLFAPTDLSLLFLKYENITKGVSVTGNLIVDVCKRLIPAAQIKMKQLPSNFILLTLHRAENVDNRETLSKFISTISHIKYPIVFPIHPRTKKSLMRFNLELPSNIIETSPLSYLEFLGIMKECILVMTDSGGLQEESIIMKKPCITLRHSTERWETVLAKANRLYPLLNHHKNELINYIIEEMLSVDIPRHPYGDRVEENVVSQMTKIVEDTQYL